MIIYDKVIRQLSGLTDRFGFNPAEVEQGSIDWHVLKLGVLSASNADCIVAGKDTAKRQGYMASLINQICTMTVEDEKPFKQLEHGKLYEGANRDSLSVALGFVEIKELPFIYMDDSLRVGVSPDGVFDNTIVELKSSYNGEHFFRFKCFDYNKKEWDLQCQFQIYATGAERHIFSMYEPRAKLCDPIFWVETEVDYEAQRRLSDAVPAFIFDLDKALARMGVEFGQHWDHMKNNRSQR